MASYVLAIGCWRSIIDPYPALLHLTPSTYSRPLSPASPPTRSLSCGFWWREGESLPGRTTTMEEAWTTNSMTCCPRAASHPAQPEPSDDVLLEVTARQIWERVVDRILGPSIVWWVTLWALCSKFMFSYVFHTSSNWRLNALHAHSLWIGFFPLNMHFIP